MWSDSFCNATSRNSITPFAILGLVAACLAACGDPTGESENTQAADSTNSTTVVDTYTSWVLPFKVDALVPTCDSFAGTTDSGLWLLRCTDAGCLREAIDGPSSGPVLLGGAIDGCQVVTARAEPRWKPVVIDLSPSAGWSEYKVSEVEWENGTGTAVSPQYFHAIGSALLIADRWKPEGQEVIQIDPARRKALRRETSSPSAPLLSRMANAGVAVCKDGSLYYSHINDSQILGHNFKTQRTTQPLGPLADFEVLPEQAIKSSISKAATQRTVNPVIELGLTGSRVLGMVCSPENILYRQIATDGQSFLEIYDLDDESKAVLELNVVEGFLIGASSDSVSFLSKAGGTAILEEITLRTSDHSETAS